MNPLPSTGGLSGSTSATLQWLLQVLKQPLEPLQKLGRSVTLTVTILVHQCRQCPKLDSEAEAGLQVLEE
jgi:hypothetical protein